MSAKHLCQVALIFAICVSLTSCNGQPQKPKIKKVPVVKVSGLVTVDGTTQEGVKYRCIPQGDFPVKEKAKALGGITGIDGGISIRVYDDQEGLPPGEYKLTFIWPKIVLRKRSRKSETEDDQLKGKYAEVKEDTFKFKVVEGEPHDLGTIDLKTK